MAKTDKTGGDLQDGILTYYLSLAKAADANVEARIAREPFDFRNHLRTKKRPATSPAGRQKVNRGS